MTPRHILRLAPALILLALAFPASAAPKDAAATAKIEEAINVHYLATDFTKAEAQLLGVIKACGKDCSPAVIGRAWMYVGLVRGSGKQDLPGAREAFAKAKEAEPTTQIDTALATPEVQGEFDAVFGGKGKPAAAAPTPAAPVAAAPVAAAPAAPAEPAAPAAPAELECSMDAGAEVETRRPIPIACTLPAGASKVLFAYKEFGSNEFVNLPMPVQNGSARATIPCSATKMAGALSFVLLVKDGGGNTIASIGSQEQPAQFAIVQTTIQPPPAFPNAAPPNRCAEEVECPPGMPGCTRAGGGGWGDACTSADPCKKGLYCSSGTCENAPTCEVDSDCASGRCSEGVCDMPDGATAEGGGFRKMWFGLHFAPDIYIFGTADNVCTIQSINAGSFSCYEADNKTPVYNHDDLRRGFPNAKSIAGGNGMVKGGAKLATMRLLASFDYAITANLLIGGRIGFAFGGGPPNANYDQNGRNYSSGKSFLPIHIEPRLTYHFISLTKTGFHPYVHVGGGLAQVDAKMEIPICNQTPLIDKSDPEKPKAIPYSDDGSCKNNSRNVIAYKRLGQGFATIGGGATYMFNKMFGATLNVNAMIMLPVSGLVIEPSLGGVVAF